MDDRGEGDIRASTSSARTEDLQSSQGLSAHPEPVEACPERGRRGRTEDFSAVDPDSRRKVDAHNQHRPLSHDSYSL